MICVSLKPLNPEEGARLVHQLEFAEIRMDDWILDRTAVRSLFSSHPKLIATCRSGSLTPEERLTLLREAVSAGAAFVDVDLENSRDFVAEIIHAATQTGCQIILSCHCYSQTPERKKLEHLVDTCFSRGADIAKIACYVKQPKDNARLLGLLDHSTRSIVVMGMGRLGAVTRVVAPFLGSPFTYASFDDTRKTASGQLSNARIKELMSILNNV